MHWCCPGEEEEEEGEEEEEEEGKEGEEKEEEGVEEVEEEEEEEGKEGEEKEEGEEEGGLLLWKLAKHYKQCYIIMTLETQSGHGECFAVR